MPIYELDGARPEIAGDCWVAPDAVLIDVGENDQNSKNAGGQNVYDAAKFKMVYGDFLTLLRTNYPNAYIYLITQAPVWEDICKVIGEERWITDADYATPKARLPRLMQIFARIEDWTKTKTKFEAMDILNKHDIPCGPILSMKEIAEEPSLRKTGTVVEVDHPKRGKYLSVGNPIKMSDSPTDVTRSPLLGEHTEEILVELGYTKDQISTLRAEGAI